MKKTDNINPMNKKVLVVFGSKSDRDVYKPIIKELDSKKISYELRICSAHRTPDELEKIMTNDHQYSCVIAGAGLAAHLPGVVASKTTKPVIGVPVHSNYSGLDAFLSIIQMPPGIPVLAVGVNQGVVAGFNAAKIHIQYEYVNLIGDPISDPKNTLIKKAKKILDQFGVMIKYSDKIDDDGINIKFVSLETKVPKSNAFVIYCPTPIDKHDIEYAINMLKHTDHGLWVGLNRADNAALAAIEVLNLDDRHEIMIEKLRKEQARTVKMHDKEEKLVKKYYSKDSKDNKSKKKKIIKNSKKIKK